MQEGGAALQLSYLCWNSADVGFLLKFTSSLSKDLFSWQLRSCLSLSSEGKVYNSKMNTAVFTCEFFLLKTVHFIHAAWTANTKITK